MAYRILVPVSEESRHGIDHTLAAVIAIFRSHLGANWAPGTTAVSYLAPANVDEPLAYYGGKVLFDQPTNYIEFDNDILATRISQIALMLGYSEHSAFVHSFQKLAGVSPSAYRAVVVGL